MGTIKRPKYNAKKTEVDGIVFDSKAEAKRYEELKLLIECGTIKDLDRQVKYELIPSQYVEIDGKKKCVERPCVYKADFVYWDNIQNKKVVEDVKGFHTPDYVIKRKLMLEKFGIRITEVQNARKRKQVSN